MTTATVEGITTATATVDLSDAGAGSVDLVIRDAAGSVAWTDSKTIDADGAIESPAIFTESHAAKLALIGTAAATVSAPVTADGELPEVIIGDDYLTVNGRAFVFTLSNPGNVSIGQASCVFAGTGIQEPRSKWQVTGSVADVGGGSLSITFELTSSITNLLRPVQHRWSAKLLDDSGNDITAIHGTTAVVAGY